LGIFSERDKDVQLLAACEIALSDRHMSLKKRLCKQKLVSEHTNSLVFNLILLFFSDVFLFIPATARRCVSSFQGTPCIFQPRLQASKWLSGHVR